MPRSIQLFDHAGHVPRVPWNSAWKEPSPDGWHDLSRWMATAWFETHDAFHDGRLTSYLLRAFGHPNLFAYDEMAQGNAWLLDVDEGWGLAVRPFPCEATGYRMADEHDRHRMVNDLRANRIFELLPLRIPDCPASPELARAIAEEFRRPVRFRDVMVNASRVAYMGELDAWPEREDAYATANVVIDPRFRIGPTHPANLAVQHPSRALPPSTADS